MFIQNLHFDFHFANNVSNTRINTENDVAHLLNSIQAMGLYQYSSLWEIKTGGRVYAKSGVGGGLIIILPNLCSIGIVSPRLDKYGNSVRGVEAGLILSQLLYLSIRGYRRHAYHQCSRYLCLVIVINNFRSINGSIHFRKFT